MTPRKFRRDREHEARREQRRRRRRTAGLAAGAAVGAVTVAAPAAQAATFTVTNTQDDAVTPPAGSLRFAINQAIADGAADTIVFQSGVSGTIELDGEELYISSAIDIQGPGARNLTVSGEESSRVFNIYFFGTARGSPLDDVTISGLTAASGVVGSEGGGIKSEYADLTVADAVVTGNTVTTDIAADGWGAGIAVGGGNLTVRNSTISGNSIVYEPDNWASRGLNGYAGQGGGIYINDDTNLLVENSTISGNDAADGGGITVDQDGTSTVDIKNSTIADNSATSEGGGIHQRYDGPRRGTGGGAIDLQSTILGDNTAPTGPDISTAGPLVQTAAFSLIEDTSGATIVPAGPNVTGQDPQLGPLANNGGPTDTQLPGGTSPALDKGLAGGLGSDQRGQPRTADDPAIANAAGGDGTDIGAVEATGAPPGRPSCRGEEATIVGTNGGDKITGTPDRDVIKGLRGRDVITGLGGDDVICGDGNIDKIKSGSGDDVVKGGNAGDRIFGGSGDDELHGGAGVDRIFGRGGDDDMIGGARQGPRGGPARGTSPGNVCDGDAGTDTAKGCETVRDVP